MPRSPHPEDVREPLLDPEGQTEISELLPKRRGRWSIRSPRQFAADNAGLLLVLVSQVFFSMMAAAVKHLESIDPSMSVLEVIVVRVAITYMGALTYMLVNHLDDPILGPKGVRLLLMLRGLSGFLAIFGAYFALEYLSLSDATVLSFLSPLCTVAAGALFLKESFRGSQALAGIVSLVGVILIARPPVLFGDGHPPVHAPHTDIVSIFKEASAAERTLAIGSALVGVLGISSGFIFIRIIGKRAHPMHVIACHSMYCGIFATIAMIAKNIPFITPSRLDELAHLLLIGVFGLVGQCLLTMGIQREAAGRASMASYTQIVFATIFQRTLFHTSPPWLSILGSFLIVSSALYIALTKESSHGQTVRSGDGERDHLEAPLHGAKAKDTNTSDSTH